MHCLYIIYSRTIDKYYVGESPNPQVRLRQHNAHHFKTGYTKAAGDWEIVLSKECGSKKEAVHLERFIKRMKSRKFVRKIILRPGRIDFSMTPK